MKIDKRPSIVKFVVLSIVFTLLCTFSRATTSQSAELTGIELLGKFLFFDENLSEPSGQSCSSCHDPDFGFVDPDSYLPVSEGVIEGLFGGRNSPSAAYAMYAPKLHYDDQQGLWIGGQFWDGRATGEVLDDPLADQAMAPFLNPVEMANETKEQVVADVANSDYAPLFKQVWGEDSFDDIETAYEKIALSIAAFERTRLFGEFSSKYDAYLAVCLDMGGAPDDCAKGIGKTAKRAGRIFSREEWYGLQLFMRENNNDGKLDRHEGAMCAACHVAEWTTANDYELPVKTVPWAPAGAVPPLFTDFSYDNLGIPKSEHELLADNPVDLGLGVTVDDINENGKFKVMTLRNIAYTFPYGHNGYFDTLKGITHFYNTRDVPGALKKGTDWPPPEYAETVNMNELGNLGLRKKDEKALVKFMQTLTDGWRR